MRQKRLHLGLLLLTLAVSQIASSPVKDALSCASQCSSNEVLGDFYYKFAPGQTYVYDFENSVKMNTELRNVELVLKATVRMSFQGSCEYSMQLDDIKMTEKFTDGGKTTDKDLTGTATSLKQYPVRFAVDAGKVTSFCPEKGETVFAANIKRAIISQFQVTGKQHDNFIITEEDVSGRCQVLYDFKKSESGFLVNKTKLIEGCLSKTHLVTHIKGHKSLYPTIFGQTPILKGKHQCQLEIGEEGHLTSSSCKESHMAKAVMAKTESVRTEIVQTLKLKEILKNPLTIKMDSFFQSKLVFQHADHSITDNKDEKAVAEGIVGEICKNGLDIKTQAQHFRKLIRSLRSFSDAEINDFSEKLEKGQCPNADLNKVVLDFYHDALPSVRTEGAILLMFKELQDDHLSPGNQKLWLRILSRVVPTTKILEASKALLVKPNSFLAVSSMINTFCLKTSNCGEEKVVKDLAETIIGKLGADCSYTPENNKTILIALRAVGNLGATNLDSIWTSLGKCIKNPSISIEHTISALQAYRRLPCNDKIMDAFELYEKPEVDTEIRITAFGTLIKCHSNPKVLKSVIEVFNREESLQVGSFVFSYFDKILKSFGTSRSLFRENIRSLLKDEAEASKRFTLEFYKYSRYFEYYKELPSLRAVAKVKSGIIYSPDAFFPRSTFFNFTLDISGNKVNFLDMGMRFTNIDAWVNRMQGIKPFGKKMDMSNVHNQWKTGDRKAYDLSEIKQKTQPTTEESAKLSYYMRVFGDEVAFENEIDIQKYLNFFYIGEPDRSSPEFTKDMNRNLMLTDGMITIPTMSGYSLQLHLETVVSSSSKVSFNYTAGKKLELELKPRVAAFVVGRMTLDSGISKMSTHLEASTYTKVGGKVVINKDSNGITVSATPTDPKAELISLNTNVYLVTGDTPLTPVNSSKVPYTKFNKCWSENMFKLIGRKLCLNYELPQISAEDESSSILLSPFFKGYTKFNLFWDGDPKLKSYEVKITCPNCWSGDLTNWKKDVEREFLFETPGSDLDRKINLKYSRKRTTTSDDVFDIKSQLVLKTPWRNFESNTEYKSTSADDQTLKVNAEYTGTKDMKMTMNWDMVNVKSSRTHNMKLVSGKYGEISSGTIKLEKPKDDSESNPSTSKSDMQLTFNKYSLKLNGDRKWFTNEIVSEDSKGYGHKQKSFSFQLNADIVDPSGKSLFKYTHESSANRTVINLSKQEHTRETHFKLCHTITSDSVPDFLNIDCKLPMIIKAGLTKTPEQIVGDPTSRKLQGIMMTVIVPNTGNDPQDTRLYMETSFNLNRESKSHSVLSKFMLPLAEVGGEFIGKFNSKTDFHFEGLVRTAKDKTHTWIAKAIIDQKLNYLINNSLAFSFKTCSNKVYGFSHETFYDIRDVKSEITTKIWNGEAKLNHTIVIDYKEDRSDLTAGVKDQLLYTATAFVNDTQFFKLMSTLLIGRRTNQVFLKTDLIGKDKTTIFENELGYEITWKDREAGLGGNFDLKLPRRNVTLKTGFKLAGKVKEDDGYITTDFVVLIDVPARVFLNASVEQTTKYTRNATDQPLKVTSKLDLKTTNEDLNTMYRLLLTSTPTGDQTKKLEGTFNLKSKIMNTVKMTFACDVDNKDKVSVSCKGVKTEVGDKDVYMADHSFTFAKSKSFKFDSGITGATEISINGDFDFSKESQLQSKLKIQTKYDSLKKASLDGSLDLTDPKNSKANVAVEYNDYKGSIDFSSVTTDSKIIKLKISAIDKLTTIYQVDHTLNILVNSYNTDCKWVLRGEEATLKASIPRIIEAGNYNPSVVISNKIKYPFDFVVTYSSEKKEFSHVLDIQNLVVGKFSININQTGMPWSGPAKLNVKTIINTVTSEVAYINNGKYDDNLDLQLNFIRIKDNTPSSNFDLKMTGKKAAFVVKYNTNEIKGSGDFSGDTNSLTGKVEAIDKAASVTVNYIFKKSLTVKAKFDKSSNYDISFVKADETEDFSPLNWILKLTVDQNFDKVVKASGQMTVNCNIKDGMGKAEISADLNYKIDKNDEQNINLELNGKRKINNLQFKGKGKYNKNEYKFEHEHTIELTENPIPNFKVKSQLKTPKLDNSYEVELNYKYKKAMSLDIQTPIENFRKFKVIANKENMKYGFSFDIMKKSIAVESDIFRLINNKTDPFEVKLILPIWDEKGMKIEIEKKPLPGTKLYKFEVKCGDKFVAGTLNVTYNFTQLFSSEPVLLYLGLKVDTSFTLRKLNVEFHHQRKGAVYFSQKHYITYTLDKKDKKEDVWKAEITYKKSDENVYNLELKTEAPKNLELKGTYDAKLLWLKLNGTYETRNKGSIDCDGYFGGDTKPCTVETSTVNRKMAFKREVLSDGKYSTKLVWNQNKKQYIQVIRKFDWNNSPVHHGKIYLQIRNPIRDIKVDLELQRCRIHGDGAKSRLYLESPPNDKANQTLEILCSPCLKQGDVKTPSITLKSSLFKKVDMNVALTISNKNLSTEIGGKLIAKGDKETEIAWFSFSKIKNTDTGVRNFKLEVSTSSGYKLVQTLDHKKTTERLEVNFTSTSKYNNYNLKLVRVPGSIYLSDSNGHKFEALKRNSKIEIGLFKPGYGEFLLNQDVTFQWFNIYSRINFILRNLTIIWDGSSLKTDGQSYFRSYYLNGVNKEPQLVLTYDKSYNKYTSIVNIDVKYNSTARAEFLRLHKEKNDAVAEYMAEKKKAIYEKLMLIAGEFKKSLEEFFEKSAAVHEATFVKNVKSDVKTAVAKFYNDNEFYIKDLVTKLSKFIIKDGSKDYDYETYVTELKLQLKEKWEMWKEKSKERIKKFVETMTTTWKDLKEEVKAAWTRVQERVSTYKTTMRSMCDRLNYILINNVFTKEDIERWKSLYEALPIRQLRLDIMEYRMELKRMFARIRGNQKEFDNMIDIYTNLTAGNFKQAFKLYFKPEHYSVDYQSDTKSLSLKMYVNPLMKKTRAMGKTIVSALSRVKDSYRLKLTLRTIRKARYLWKYNNMTDFVKKMLPPYPTFGHVVASQNLLQYNGEVIYNASASCTYLLAHETTEAKFSVIATTDNSILIQASSKDGKIILIHISSDGTVSIEGDNAALSHTKSINVPTFKLTNGKLESAGGPITLKSYAESEINYANTIIKKNDQLTKIIMCPSFGGLVIKWFPNHGLGSVIVPGKYFSKVIGLLGKNNYESGAVNLQGEKLKQDQALKEWSLGQQCDTGSNLSTDLWKAKQCELIVTNSKSYLCETSVSPNSIKNFVKMCEVPNPNYCAILSGYKLTCDMQGAYVNTPSECKQLY